MVVKVSTRCSETMMFIPEMIMWWRIRNTKIMKKAWLHNKYKSSTPVMWINPKEPRLLWTTAGTAASVLWANRLSACCANIMFLEFGLIYPNVRKQSILWMYLSHLRGNTSLTAATQKGRFSWLMRSWEGNITLWHVKQRSKCRCSN